MSRSTHQPISYDQALGVDTTTKPFLVGKDRFIALHNLRGMNGSILQVPPKMLLDATKIVGHTRPVQQIVAIPTGVANQCVIVLFTDQKVYQLGSTIAGSVQLGTKTIVGGQPDVV